MKKSHLDSSISPIRLVNASALVGDTSHLDVSPQPRLGVARSNGAVAQSYAAANGAMSHSLIVPRPDGVADELARQIKILLNQERMRIQKKANAQQEKLSEITNQLKEKD